MTAESVLSFDVNAGQIASANAHGLRVSAVATPAVPRHDERAMKRAHLVSVYAGLLGAQIAVADLLEQFHRAGGPDHAPPGLTEISLALRSAGLHTRELDAPALPMEGWPALAAMANGQVVLVLRMTVAGPEIYDPTTPDHRAEVPLDEFLRVYSGRILQARVPVEGLQARHVPSAKAPHWFWGEFARHRRAFVEVSAASLVANLLAVAVSLFSMQVYDRVIPYQSEPTLWVLALGVLLAIVLEGVLKVARSALMDRSGRRIELAVQARLMDRVLGMKARPSERKPSETVSAIRDFGAVREFFTAATVGTLADLPFLLVFLALVVSIGGPLVWVLIMGGVLMVLPGFLVRKRLVALAASTQGASVQSARLLYETVYEHETVTTQRGEDRVRRVWAELVTLSAVKGSDQRHLTALLSTWAQAVQQATYVAAVVAGTYLVFDGQFTVGTIIAIGLLTGRTLGPLAQLSSILARWSQVKGALTALEAIATARQAEEEGRAYLRRDRLQGNYDLRHVEFRYDPQASPTVDIAAVTIPAGQHVAVLGTNGAGKSTLLRLLAGLYEPTKGRVLIDGVDLGQVHPRDLRRGIGYLGQDVRLVAGTLRDNLNLSQLERDDDRLFAALDFAGLGPFVRNHPRGLDLEIRELGEGLSVGQRQSIGWARLWLQDPQVVLLDEPTAALDQTLEATMVSRLKGWLDGRTAVIATHRVPILQLTTRTLILQNGRLAVDGPKDAVLAHLAKAQAAGAGA